MGFEVWVFLCDSLRLCVFAVKKNTLNLKGAKVRGLTIDELCLR